jgi:hypothetical protein
MTPFCDTGYYPGVMKNGNARPCFNQILGFRFLNLQECKAHIHLWSTKGVTLEYSTVDF